MCLEIDAYNYKSAIHKILTLQIYVAQPKKSPVRNILSLDPFHTDRAKKYQNY